MAPGASTRNSGPPSQRQPRDERRSIKKERRALWIGAGVGRSVGSGDASVDGHDAKSIVEEFLIGQSAGDGGRNARWDDEGGDNLGMELNRLN